jgi:hypothetical protein
MKVLLWSLLVISLLAVPAFGQLPLGTVANVQALNSCPSQRGFAAGMHCYQATVSCPLNAEIGVYYGVRQPAGQAKGTIMIASGGGGHSVNIDLPGYSSPLAFLAAGYRVIEFVWSSDWEDTGLQQKSIKTAACGPSTIMAYLNSTFSGLSDASCAYGFSGGSGALGYALTYYNAGSYLDKVELLSGPAFGDVEEGCKVPNAPPIQICHAGQYNCIGNEWTAKPQYIQGSAVSLRNWTGDQSCQGSSVTSEVSNIAWKEQSNVDGLPDASYYYPQTALAGWICSNAINSSAPQGEFFYNQFTTDSQTAGYSLTRIDGCAGSEGIEAGRTPRGELGFTAVSQDMIQGCVNRH